MSLHHEAPPRKWERGLTPSTQRGSPGDTLAMYYMSSDEYGLRLRSPATRFTCAEHDELAALRKAQAWGAPLFQRAHPGYTAALARLAELEAKERAAAG